MGIYQLYPEDLAELTNVNIPSDFYFSRFQKIEHGLMNSNTIEFVKLMRAYARGKDCFYRELTHQYNSNKEMLLPYISEKIKSKEKILDTLLSDKKKSDSEYTEIQISAALMALKDKYDILVGASTMIFHSDTFEGKIRAFSDLCFDVKVFFTSHAGRRFRSIPGIELFPIAKELVDYNVFPSAAVSPTSIFLIRQAIETHFLQSLGIEKIEIEKQKGYSPMPFSNVLGYLKQLYREKKLCLCTNIYVIDKIYRWTNRYIHTGQFDYPYWYLSMIIDYLYDFFFECPDMSEHYKKESFSICASIYIESKYMKNYYKNMENALKTKLKSNIKITPLRRQNLITVSQDELNKLQAFVKSQHTQVDFSKY